MFDVRRLLPFLFLTMPCAVLAEDFVFDLPTDDRWHYPFNFTPGTRAIGTTFGATGEVGFNDRDGLVVVAWDTSQLIDPDLGPDSYLIESIQVTLTCAGGGQWDVDLTVDDWSTFNGGTDADPGRPIELFGAGFDPGLSASSWTEFSQYAGSDSIDELPRNPFPFVFQDGTGDLLHVEDNVRGYHNENLGTPLCGHPQGVCPFTPAPWAIGVPDGYVPGNQNDPFDVHFDVDLDLSDGRVREYFQEQLDAGRVILIVSSLAETVFQGPQSGFPAFFMKEVLPFEPQAKAPTLTMGVVILANGDLNGDGEVDLDDWVGFDDCFAGPGEDPYPGFPLTRDDCFAAFDFDRNQEIDLLDAAHMQRRFTGQP